MWECPSLCNGECMTLKGLIRVYNKDSTARNHNHNVIAIKINQKFDLVTKLTEIHLWLTNQCHNAIILLHYGFHNLSNPTCSYF